MKSTARRIYYWVHHTGRYDGNTGIQRVVRALGAALARMADVELVPVRWCSKQEAIVRAEAAWTSGFARWGGPDLAEPAEAGVPLHLTLADADRRWGEWLIIPEVTHLGSAAEVPSVTLPVALDYARYYGLRSAAVFYDLIPLREPGYEELKAGHTAYVLALAAADLILPISRTAADDLVAWWREQGHDPDRLPPVRPVLLAAEMAGVPRVTGADPMRETADGRRPVHFLAVGSVEPRKNQLAVMLAVNRLRSRRPELEIRLDVVGGLHHAVADAVRLEAARSDGYIRLHHYTPEAVLRTMMCECDATVFVSLAEGFGLPIVESLWQGKPCLCSNTGAMAEIAAGGGCLTVDPRDPDAIEGGLERLAEDVELRARLGRAACSRKLTQWSDYAETILAELDAASPVPLLAVIEGSAGGGEAIALALEAASARVWRHHWRVDSQAILPGFRHTGDPAPGVGRGDVRGLWALLPLSTTRGPAEAMRIQDEARGLGLKLAVMIEAGHRVSDADLMVLTGGDLAIFACAPDRDAALHRALRTVPRTATLRHRFRVGGDIRETLAAIASRAPADRGRGRCRRCQSGYSTGLE